jgi:glutathione-regulated potassium-efflux system ancillary protein KefG
MTRRVDVDDLIDAHQVAARLGLSHRNSVATYMTRYADFPRPVIDTGSGRCRLWSRKAVDRWRAQRLNAGKVRKR